MEVSGSDRVVYTAQPGRKERDDDGRGKAEAQQLEMQVDSEEYSLSVAGEKLPHILRLKLNESKIPSIRDLGTGWKNLRVLWLSRCGLEDLHGMNALPCLTELYISFNDVADITPVADLENIEVLDLESNRVDDLNSVEYLGFCRALTQLTLEGNPVCALPGYRRRVASKIPQLAYLDENRVTDEEREGGASDDEAEAEATENDNVAQDRDHGSESTSSGAAASEEDDLDAQLKRLESAELALISDGIKYTRMEPKEVPLCYYGKDALTLEDLFQNFNENLPIHRRNFAQRPTSACGFRPGESSASIFAATSRRMARPSTAGPRNMRPHGASFTGAQGYMKHQSGAHCGVADGGGDGGSNLTRGGDCSLAGNAAKALLQRKSRRDRDPSAASEDGDSQGEMESESSSRSSHDAAAARDNHASGEMDMLEELKKWKLSNNLDRSSSFDSIEADNHVTYQCLNLETRPPQDAQEIAHQQAHAPPVSAKPSRPTVPPKVRTLKTVVIRDENVGPPGGPNLGHNHSDVVESKKPAEPPAVSAAYSDRPGTMETLEQYDHYKHSQSLHSPKPRPPMPQTSKGAGPGAGFQRKTIVRSAGHHVKVDKSTLVAARMKRFSRRSKEGKQGGLQDKILDGAEHW